MSTIEHGTTAGTDDAAVEELHEIVGRQRAAFLAEPFPSLEERQALLGALAGMVMSHAATMFAPTPQRTAPRLRLAPTPSTEPVTTCVVLTGRPIRVAPWMTLAPMSCAEKPVAGSSLKMLQPSVRIIRHPPA